MDYWKLAGVFYGYPNCCSDWFANRLEGKVPFELNEDQRLIENGSGFIPCPSCAKKIRAGEATHKDLIQNRIFSKPYPNDYKSEKELDFFISEMEHKLNLNPTLYEGNYIDVRDGIRYHITFTYEIRDGEIFNEKEINKKELGRAL